MSNQSYEVTNEKYAKYLISSPRPFLFIGEEHREYLEAFSIPFTLNITQEDIDYAISVEPDKLYSRLVIKSALERKFINTSVDNEYYDVFTLRQENRPTICIDIGPKWPKQDDFEKAKAEYKPFIDAFENFWNSPRPMEITVPWSSK